MPKTKHKPNQQLHFSWRIALHCVLFLVLTALIGAQLVFNVVTYNKVSYLDMRELKGLVIEGLNSVTKPAVLEPETGKVYLPLARLVLPPNNSKYDQILYSHDPSFENSPEEVRITTSTTMSGAISSLRQADDMDELFSALPRAQDCARQIRIVYTFDDYQAQGYASQGYKRLSNGKTAFFFSDGKCNKNIDELVSYLKEIDSY